MADRIVRIAILGAGAMGREHADAYSGIPGVSVAGVFSRDERKASEVADLCGARPTTDIEALLRSGDIDAVDICLPTPVHRAFVVPALESGKHVFCETPLALNLDDARATVRAARGAGRLLQVGLLMRSVAPYAHVKSVADSGEHGRLLSIATYRLGSYLRPGAPDHKDHYSDPSTELMTFDFDVVGWLMGAPARLSASAARTPQGGPGEVSALLQYDDGRHATVVASGLMPAGYPFSVGFRALFERASFQLDNVFADGPPDSRFTFCDGDAAPQPVAIPGANPYAVELRRFVDCIRGEADPQLLDAERAVEALALSVATQTSIAEGRTVNIDA